MASLLLLCVAAMAAFHISARSEIIPDRPRFVAFPERIGPWQGHAFLLEPEIERLLRPDDYILSDYKTIRRQSSQSLRRVLCFAKKKR